MRVIRTILLPDDPVFQKQAERMGFVLLALGALVTMGLIWLRSSAAGAPMRARPITALLAVVIGIVMVPVRGILQERLMSLSSTEVHDFADPEHFSITLPVGKFMVTLLSPVIVLALAALFVGLYAGHTDLGIAVCFVHLISCSGELTMAGELAACPEATHVRDSAQGVEFLAAQDVA